MLVKRSNIKPEDDGASLTGRLAEVCDNSGPFEVGEIVRIKSVDVRSGQPQMNIVDLKGTRSYVVVWRNLYLIPQSKEDFDQEISDNQKVISELQARKTFLEETKLDTFDENGFKMFTFKKEIMAANGDEAQIEGIIKKIVGS